MSALDLEATVTRQAVRLAGVNAVLTEIDSSTIMLEDVGWEYSTSNG
jgi:hypothetical protein